MLDPIQTVDQITQLHHIAGEPVVENDPAGEEKHMEQQTGGFSKLFPESSNNTINNNDKLTSTSHKITNNKIRKPIVK